MNAISQLKDSSPVGFQAASVVREAAVTETAASPNVVAQIIKSGAPKPHATISNTMVAEVDRYEPPPGRNLRHYLSLDVDKAGRDPTTVVDALQRYFNVRPRREPIADPKDVATTDSFPTLIMDEAQAFNDNDAYRFSVNGIVQRQSTPSFYARGGYLKVRIVGPGVTSIQTPPTVGEPGIPVGPSANRGSYYPPAYAAQLAMGRLSESFDPSRKMDVWPVGPNLTRGPNDTLASVANTLAPLRGPLANLGSHAIPSPTEAASAYVRAPSLQNAVIDALGV
ncbi:MAG: hypothetical protein LBO66_00810 [Deltaproteobacteria bacterium]|nr:hypothetical protein [Deltaproteobacteria bacterium]